MSARAESEDLRSARLFRAALDAMANPGRIIPLPVDEAASPREGSRHTVSMAPPAIGARAEPSPSAPSPAAMALIGLLADLDAPWWLASDCRSLAAVETLRFMTGAAMADGPSQARFLCGGWRALVSEAIDAARLGAPDRPDESATLIVDVAGFRSGARAASALLSGPGLAAATLCHIEGVDASFWQFVRRNRARYPIGLDLYLCAGAEIIGLPRSTSAV